MFTTYFLNEFLDKALVNWRTEDTDNGIKLEVDLPGVKKSDIQVEAKDNVLSVSWKKKEEKFSKSWKIPQFSEDISAKCEDGILTLLLSESKKDKKLIPVS